MPASRSAPSPHSVVTLPRVAGSRRPGSDRAVARAPGLGLLALAGLAVAVACSGQAVPVDVEGTTGECTEQGTTWSGESVGGVLPGTILERTVTCPAVTMSDERVSGAYESKFRCTFSEDGERFIGSCTQDTTLTNEGGAWSESGGAFTVTVVPGEPSTIVESGSRQGSGEYDGLRFVYRVEASGDYPWQITGTLEEQP
jgi:hypothetical protein